MFWSLVLEIRKHALSWITICMIYHRSCIDTRFKKHKYLDIITWVSIFMHHTSSTIVSSEGINLQKSSWDWGSSSKTYISSKPSFTLAHQAQFRTSPPSPVLFGPSPALPGHQAQLRTGPPSPVSHWPPTLAPYWPTKPISLGPLSLSRDPLLRNGQLLCSSFGQRPSP